jgi:hypothetical protein
MERNCQPEARVVVPMPRRKSLAMAIHMGSNRPDWRRAGASAGHVALVRVLTAGPETSVPSRPVLFGRKKAATRVNLAVGSGAARVRRRREVWLPWWWCARRGTRDREGVAAPRTVARCGMCTCMYYYSLGDVPKTAARPASGSAPNSGSWLAQLPAASPVSRRVRG